MKIVNKAKINCLSYCFKIKVHKIALKAVFNFHRAPTIFDVICNDKSKRHDDFKTGVYKVPLKNLVDNQLETYIGATARNFKHRIREHKDSICRGNLCTALVQRVFEKNVEVLWQGAKVVKCALNCRDLPLMEKLQIIKHSEMNRVINIRQAEGVSAAWRYAIKKNF